MTARRPVAALVAAAATIAAVSLAAPTAAAAQEVLDSSFVAHDGTRVLRQSLVVPATRQQVWDAFTTTEGIRAWMVPVAHADYRVGGAFETSYRPDAKLGDPTNIKNRYLAYLPLRMLAIQAVQSPPSFPHRELLADLATVIELDAVDATHVRVTVSMVGYKPGAGYDAIYGFFQAGNAYTLRKLHERFTRGPVDWQKALAPKAAPGGSR